MSETSPVDLVMFWALLGITTFFAVLMLINILSHIFPALKKQSTYNKGMKAVEEMKANGDVHQWVAVNLNGELRYVCKKTGYVPTLDGFIDVSKIEAYLQQAESYNSQIEEIRAYMEEVASNIGSRYDLTSSQIIDIIKEYKESETRYLSDRINKKTQEFLQKKH